jgi:hypothetical protein
MPLQSWICKELRQLQEQIPPLEVGRRQGLGSSLYSFQSNSFQS